MGPSPLLPPLFLCAFTASPFFPSKSELECCSFEGAVVFCDSVSAWVVCLEGCRVNRCEAFALSGGLQSSDDNRGFRGDLVAGEVP